MARPFGLIRPQPPIFGGDMTGFLAILTLKMNARYKQR